jgi:hypothetical protein
MRVRAHLIPTLSLGKREAKGEGVIEIASKWGKSWLCSPGKGSASHVQVFSLGTNPKKIASGGNCGYIGPWPRGKMEIPVETKDDFTSSQSLHSQSG